MTKYSYDYYTQSVTNDGETHTFVRVFDAYNRLQSSTLDDGTQNTYEYDSNGRIATIRHGDVEVAYSYDGNMTFDGVRTYAYDCENRLASVSTNGVTIQTNFYDHKGRRVRKVTPNAEHTFIYDGWNLEKEIIIADGSTNTIEYIWGRDLSGTLQGAGGVGGLGAVKRNGALYVPLYDQNGNITDYIAASGSVVAHYDYDAFGSTIAQSGSMSELFAHHFSTKYFDSETGLYYYGCRFYSPTLMRWINRDPIGIADSINERIFCQNASIMALDALGLRIYQLGIEVEPMEQFDEDFSYDASVKPTMGDRWSWFSWGALLCGAEALGHLEDATILYRHYRTGSGTDMTINYLKAYNEDASIKEDVDDAVREAQIYAEKLSVGKNSTFEMCSDAGVSRNYPKTENWQKAIGTHVIWGFAKVETCGSKHSMQIKIHELDRYNFNRGNADVATGLPDNANGRFATLGWAKSFLTRGTISFLVKWEKGKINETSIIENGGNMNNWRNRPRGR